MRSTDARWRVATEQPANWQAICACHLAGRTARLWPETGLVAKAISLGAALRDARREAGLSTRDLERATGISNAQISKVEGGVRPNPSFRTVVRLARGIGISLDDLVARSEGRASQRPAVAVTTGAKALASLQKAKVEHERLGKTIEAASQVLGQTGTTGTKESRKH